MSQSVGSTKIIATQATEVFPGSRDYEFTLVTGGPAFLYADGAYVGEITDVPLIRTAADTGDQVVFALGEATVHAVIDEYGEAERAVQLEKTPKKAKAEPAQDAETPSPKKSLASKAASKTSSTKKAGQ
jgi:ribosome-interacting GTPase 1